MQDSDNNNSVKSQAEQINSSTGISSSRNVNSSTNFFGNYYPKKKSDFEGIQSNDNDEDNKKKVNCNSQLLFYDNEQIYAENSQSTLMAPNSHIENNQFQPANWNQQQRADFFLRDSQDALFKFLDSFKNELKIKVPLQNEKQEHDLKSLIDNQNKAVYKLEKLQVSDNKNKKMFDDFEKIYKIDVNQMKMLVNKNYATHRLDDKEYFHTFYNFILKFHEGFIEKFDSIENKMKSAHFEKHFLNESSNSTSCSEYQPADNSICKINTPENSFPNAINSEQTPNCLDSENWIYYCLGRLILPNFTDLNWKDKYFTPVIKRYSNYIYFNNKCLHSYVSLNLLNHNYCFRFRKMLQDWPESHATCSEFEKSFIQDYIKTLHNPINSSMEYLIRWEYWILFLVLIADEKNFRNVFKHEPISMLTQLHTNEKMINKFGRKLMKSVKTGFIHFWTGIKNINYSLNKNYSNLLPKIEFELNFLKKCYKLPENIIIEKIKPESIKASLFSLLNEEKSFQKILKKTNPFDSDKSSSNSIKLNHIE